MAGLPETETDFDKVFTAAVARKRGAADERRRMLASDPGRRERVINAALAAGKIGPSGVDRWRREWDADPEGAEATIALLAGTTAGLGLPAGAGSSEGSFADGSVDHHPEDRWLFPPGSPAGPSLDEVRQVQYAGMQAYSEWLDELEAGAPGAPMTDAEERRLFGPDWPGSAREERRAEP
jgi:hypothetical protein